MIPKIIHLCWLSGDPYPADIQKCLDSWKRILPDYEVWVWDTKRFDINSTLWTKQAFECKKYAFAADYIRLYALYNYGGIYLDSDIMMYKSFDQFLNLPYFIGQQYNLAFEAAVIGAEKHTQWVADILDRYQNRPFIKEDGSFDIKTAPTVFYEMLSPKYQFWYVEKPSDYRQDGNIINVFPKKYFNSRDAFGIHPTSISICAHNYAGNWLNGKESALKRRLKALIPHFCLRMYCFIKHNFIDKTPIHAISFLNIKRQWQF